MPANYDEVFGRDEHVESNASRLLRLAKGELSEEERLRFEEHLTTCPACRLELLQMREVVEHQRAAWEKARMVIRDFVAARRPAHERFIDSIWALLEVRGLLGVLPDLASPQTQPAIGLLPPASDRRLPAIIAVLSRVADGVISTGLTPGKAVERDRTQAMAILREVGQLNARELSWLDEFAEVLRSARITDASTEGDS